MSRNYDSSSSTTNSSGAQGSLTQSSLESEATDIRNQLKELDDVELPAKKDAGKVGRKIQVNVNFFRVIVDSKVTITHFDFNIKEVNAVLGKESVKKRDEKMKFFQTFMKEVHPGLVDKVAFDGMSNCYFMGEKELIGSTGEDAGKSFNYQYASRGSRKRDFTVTIRRVNQFSANDINKYLSGHTSDLRQEAIQAFDVVLRHQASTTMVQCGRNFFSPEKNQNAKDIGSGREVWFGYHQSLKAIEGKSGGSLALNIDTAACAFMRPIRGHQLVLEICNPRDGEREMSQPRFFNDWRRKELEKKMKGIQFNTTYLKYNSRTHRCGGLTRNGAGNQRFQIENGPQTTVADYFAKEYKIKLRFPDMPCLMVGNPKSGNVKYFPLELMMVAARQRSPGKLDEMGTANMIKAVATPAPVRLEETERQAKQAIENALPMARKYGMKINPKMESQTARVLPAPGLEYGQKKVIPPRDGQWDTRGSQFYNAASCERWIIVNFNTRCNDQTIQNFADQLCRHAKTQGMKMEAPSKVFHVRDQRDLETKLGQCAANKMQLCMVIMARRNTQEYSFIKAQAETQYGIQTQCIQSRNVDRVNGQLLGNLLQKINTKMGGINTRISGETKLSIFKRPAMVVGISMTHPGAGSDNPTIVSCTFTCDASVSKYVAHHRLQVSKFGIVADLKDLMIEGLKSFFKRTGKKPEKIVVFRGGGSEGELQKIAKYEVAKIKEAFTQLGKGHAYSPGLTFIVVNKMHHMRNFATERGDQIGKSGNVPAGTIVDTNVTSKSLCDFYITSSQGIQGTSRPTHYTLVYDENDLSADSLQMMSWHLCHGYARCTRSVGIPVPVYYAQLDCERVSRYLNDQCGSDAGSVHMAQDDEQAQRVKELEKNICVKAEIPDMYFV